MASEEHAGGGETAAPVTCRAKLFRLVDRDATWEEQGTGHVSVVRVNRVQANLRLVDETNGSLIYDSPVLSGPSAYQVQQHTLIVWTDLDETEKALSFEEAAGVQRICEEIARVQAVNFVADSEQNGGASGSRELSPMEEDAPANFPLPPAEMGQLENIEKIFLTPMTDKMRSHIARTIVQKDYIRSLLDVFKRAEDLEDLDSLHALFRIFKYITMLNDTRIFEVLFDSEYFFDIVGVFEYDPLNGRRNHRDFFRNKVTFKNPVKFTAEEADTKIHLNYQKLYNAKFKEDKTFICVSTTLSWGKTKPDEDDPDAPLTEEDYRRRKPHPNFKVHTATEKSVIKFKRNKLRTYVVCAGLMYGEGENNLHFLLKLAWHGQVEALPCIGEGDNQIPTIHARDCAKIVAAVARTQPEQRYIVAVDEGNNSLREIVDAISGVLGPNKVDVLSRDEAMLLKEVTTTELDMLTVNLNMEAATAHDLIDWQYEDGFAANIRRIVSEYRKVRNLTPLKIFLHGPPGVGKSYIAAALCKNYRLHHIRITDVIKDGLAAADAEKLEELNEAKEENGGRIPDSFVFQFFRNTLRSMKCQNQGFVLDGFPKTLTQAEELFAEVDDTNNDEDDEENVNEALEGLDRSILPDFVVSLQADDEFIKQRILALPEKEVAGTHNNEEGLARRLAQFREENKEEKTVVNFFDEREIIPLVLKVHLVAEHENPDGTISVARQGIATDDLLAAITKYVGAPHNYGLTTEERAAQRKRQSEEETASRMRHREENEQREREEAQERTLRAADWAARLQDIEKQERELLEGQSMPLRKYLMDNVMPTLIEALVEVSKVRPTDPVDYVAEYLFRYTAGVPAPAHSQTPRKV